MPLLRAARAHPERAAMMYFNRQISYGQLLDEVQRMAGALEALGVGTGRPGGHHAAQHAPVRHRLLRRPVARRRRRHGQPAVHAA